MPVQTIPTDAHPVDAYAQAVVRGQIPAGKYHRLSCLRHLRDRAREGTREFPYVFDAARADRFVRFAGSVRHVRGEWAGRRIILQPFQVFRLGSIFGWVHRTTGLRRFRTSYNEIPRKNGKSLEAAIVAVYVTFFDGEPGAEGYCAATQRAQAKIVFAVARQIVQRSDLRLRLRVLENNISRASSGSKLEPVSADYNSLDGLNPSLIVLDEYHALKTRGMVDVLDTATAARRQPLTFQITTAGDDPVSPCGDQHEYAVNVLDGVVVDETLFAFIAHADIDDDWQDETTWAKANPNYGVSVSPDDLRIKAAKAANQPSALAAFLQKHLNLWVNRGDPWLPLDGWRAGQTVWARDALDGRACWAGIDLSSKTDLTAIVLTFPPDETSLRWRYLGVGLTPADTLAARAIRDRVPYEQWIADGWLRTNPGKRIDHGAVRAILNELGERYDVQEVGIDPWNAGNLPTDLTADAFVVTEVPQNFGQMSPPSKEFEADVLDGLADWGGNPLATHHASNVVIARDTKDNIYPTKKRSRGRIDLIVAGIIARKLATVPPEDDAPTSAYADHGVECV